MPRAAPPKMCLPALGVGMVVPRHGKQAQPVGVGSGDGKPPRAIVEHASLKGEPGDVFRDVLAQGPEELHLAGRGFLRAAFAYLSSRQEEAREREGV